MSRRAKIRWRKKDRKEVTNAVRNFNSKITRILKKNPELAEYMPARVSTADFIAKSETRQDFNRELNSLKRFMKKGVEAPVMSETGIKTTMWFKKEMSLKVAQINRNRTREAKEANVSTTKGTMGTIQSNNLKHKKYNLDKIRLSDWDKYIATVEKQLMGNYKNDKMDKYKENYLKAVLDNLTGADNLEEFYNYVLNNLSAEQMYNAYYDDPVLQIQFTSDPLPSNVIVNNALTRWRRLNGEEEEEELFLE